MGQRLTCFSFLCFFGTLNTQHQNRQLGGIFRARLVCQLRIPLGVAWDSSCSQNSTARPNKAEHDDHAFRRGAPPDHASIASRRVSTPRKAGGGLHVRGVHMHARRKEDTSCRMMQVLRPSSIRLIGKSIA